MTIRPHILAMKPGMSIIRMKQRWGVHNHIGTVHAIAVCNLVELTMGMTAGKLKLNSHIAFIRIENVRSNNSV